MSPQRVIITLLGLSAGTVPLASCGDTTEPPGNGTVIVVTSTSGIDFPAGYTLIIGQATSRPMTTNDSVSVSLPPGTYSLSLEGITQNCQIQPQNFVRVDILAGKTAGPVRFTLACTRSDGHVAEMAIIPEPTTLGVGESVQLAVQLWDQNGIEITGRDVSWESSAAAQATVSAAGVLLGVGRGDATITATAVTITAPVETNVASLPIRVGEPAASVVVSPASVTIGGENRCFPFRYVLDAELRDAAGNVLAGRALNWTSSNPRIVKVIMPGGILPLSAGTVTITASTGLQSGSAKVTSLGPNTHICD